MASILLIEDNLHNLKLAELILEKIGHSVTAATDGPRGLQLARQQRPDVIVMDVQMPGMDGLQVTRELKRDPATAGIKVLALTALAMKGDEARILAAGCDAYLAKPYHYQQLQAAVTALL